MRTPDQPMFTSKRGAFEARLEEAVLVPVPEALSHRVLLAQRGRKGRHLASAALVVLAIAIAALAVPAPSELSLSSREVHAVGPEHPAVAAISLVADEMLELPQSGNAAAMTHELERLGLTLKEDAYAYYAGGCRLPDTECDLLIVSTPEAYANVVLVPHYPSQKRMVVEDRDMTALINPAGAGAYIVVGRSPEFAEQIDRLFISAISSAPETRRPSSYGG